jgi:hypothetical protein
MTYPVLLSRLLVAWQKVADMYNIPVHVFQNGDTYLAVSNEAQGAGQLVETLAPRASPVTRRQYQCQAKPNRRRRRPRLGPTAI